MAGVTLGPRGVAAQSERSTLAVPGSVEDDRRRVAHIIERGATDGFLLRSASSLWRGDSAGRWRVTGVLPQIALRWNNALPTWENDGALWSARGASVLLRGGVAVDRGRLTLLLTPELAASENRVFEVIAATTPGRSTYASPWHTGLTAGDAPMDLPLRFGDRPRRTIGLGQSTAMVRVGPMTVGGSTENQWWGPGWRSAIVLSNAAAGFPHAFLRTSRPIESRLGTIEGRWIAGALTPSTYFDTARAERARSISAVAVTFAPARFRALTIGVERAVIRDTRARRDFLRHASGALTLWEAPPSVADDSARAKSGRGDRAGDQLFGVMARLVAQRTGFELYGEWVRQELPRSLRELLLAPQASQGYQLGVQWVQPKPERAAWRLRGRAEVLDLEQAVAIDALAVRDFYTGFATRAGFTQRGQPLGAATGSGSSMQSIALDVLTQTTEAGVFATRVRWENDALYRQPNANFFRHDVSITGGVRAVRRWPRLDATADVSLTSRINYLFQNGFNNPGGVRTVDIRNVSLGMTLVPR